MKVKDLIKILSDFNKDADVLIHQYDSSLPGPDGTFSHYFHLEHACNDEFQHKNNMALFSQGIRMNKKTKPIN